VEYRLHLLLQLRQIHIQHKLVQKHARSARSIQPARKNLRHAVEERKCGLEQHADVERVWLDQDTVMPRVDKPIVRVARLPERRGGLGSQVRGPVDETRDCSFQDAGELVFVPLQRPDREFGIRVAETEDGLVKEIR